MSYLSLKKRKNRQKDKSTNKGRQRFVLDIGEHGAILIHMQGNMLLSRLYAADSSENNIKMIYERLLDFPKVPLAVLLDGMEQAYTIQKFPPVSKFGISKLVARKLEREFPGDELKGAVLLGRSEGKRKDWNYLFCSVASNENIQKWMRFVHKLPNRLLGFYLLPVETATIIPLIAANEEDEFIIDDRAKNGSNSAIGKLKFWGSKKNNNIEDDNLTNKEKDGSDSGILWKEEDDDDNIIGGNNDVLLEEEGNKWHLIVAHNKLGGFRQILTKNGRTIFSRLAQPIGENDIEMIAGNIEQEIASSMEYFKRMLDNEQQKIDITIIASADILAYIGVDGNRFDKILYLSPVEAAEKLNMVNVAQKNDHFADVVLSAIFCKKFNPILRLNSKFNAKLDKIRKANMAFRVAAVLMVLVFGGLIVSGVIENSEIIEKTETINRKKNSVDRQIASLNEQKLELPDDIEKINDVTEIFNFLSENEQDFFVTISGFAAALDNNILTSEITWHENQKDKIIRDNSKTKSSLVAELEFSNIANSGNMDSFFAKASKLSDSILQYLPQHKVNYTRLPDVEKKSFTISFDEDIEQADSDIVDEGKGVIYNAEITIETKLAGEQE